MTEILLGLLILFLIISLLPWSYIRKIFNRFLMTINNELVVSTTDSILIDIREVRGFTRRDKEHEIEIVWKNNTVLTIVTKNKQSYLDFAAELTHKFYSWNYNNKHVTPIFKFND